MGTPAHHFVNWYTFAGLLWSSLMVELPAVKMLLQRSWGVCFFSALFAHWVLPAMVIGLPYAAYAWGWGWGGEPEITKRGIGFTMKLEPFSPTFFYLCGALALFITVVKAAFLRTVAATGVHLFAVCLLAVFCFIGTTSFLTGMLVEPERLAGMVTQVVLEQMGHRRHPAAHHRD